MTRSLAVATVDYHTAGEPFRIVSGGLPPLRGRTLLERRAYVAKHLDHYRQLLVNEPRGHADMYGCYVTEPDDDGADLGLIFFHNQGYSTACGHGVIAIATWAIDHGVVAPEQAEGEATVVVDVPSGRVTAVAQLDGQRVRSVRFRNVPAFVQQHDLLVTTSAGSVAVDICFGGACYVCVPAQTLGLQATPDHLDALIALGREIKQAVNDAGAANHPSESHLGGVYGVIFFEELADEGSALRQRNVTVFADGEVDRSPCGSGTSARLAALDADPRTRDRTLISESVVGTRFGARVVGRVDVDGRPCVLTEVSGSAWLTGYHQFVLAADDPVGTGFLLR